MTISDTQRDMVRKKRLTEELQRGNYPSVELIEGLVEEAFKERPAGIPRFTYIAMNKGQASSSSDYNSLFEGIKDDLDISFEEIKRLNNRLMSLFSYYESSRIRIHRMLDELEMKTNALEERIAAKENKEVIGDTFNHFLFTDFKGDSSRNIPKTTSFINLLQNEVEMKHQKNGTTKIDLSKAKIHFTTDKNHQVIHLSPFQAAIGDHLHESWKSIVVTKEPISVSGTLTVELDEPTYFSNLMIDLQATKPTHVTLSISEDGEEFFSLETRKLISTYQWVFEPRPIKAIQLTMNRKEHDRQNGSEYEYLFGLKHLEAIYEQYEKESYFVSNPFSLLDHLAVKRVSLDVDDYQPSDTSIRYYVGFDYDHNVIEWQEIRKDRPVITDMVRSHQFEIHHRTEGYGDIMIERMGRKFYRIATLPHQPLKKSIKLNIGRNMWLKETIPAPFTYHSTDHDSDEVVYQTGIHDWVRTVSARKAYMRVQNGFDYLEANRFHRYTTYFYSDKPMTFDATIMGTKDTSHSVFLNGGQIKAIDHRYPFSLQSGWNKIEVYVYSRKINEEIVLDFYHPNMDIEIFASRNSLEEVSLYDLVNNTSARIHDRFAIDDEGNLIVNYDPRRLDVQSHFKKAGSGLESKGVSMANGIEYSLSYEYSVSEETKHAIRLMAILSKEREDVHTTPRIRSYKLLIE